MDPHGKQKRLHKFERNCRDAGIPLAFQCRDILEAAKIFTDAFSDAKETLIVSGSIHKER